MNDVIQKLCELVSQHTGPGRLEFVGMNIPRSTVTMRYMKKTADSPDLTRKDFDNVAAKIKAIYDFQTIQWLLI